MVSSLHSKFMVTENGHTRSLILPKTDKRVQFVRSLVTKLGNACAYFSPECTTYMNNMEVIVVDDDEVNAYTTMGSVVVVYTGLLDYFEKMKEEGKIKDYEEVRIEFAFYCSVLQAFLHMNSRTPCHGRCVVHPVI